MKRCLVKAHKAGLFSLINNVITCADLYDEVCVDWTGSIYSPDEDLWPHLFERLPFPRPPFDVIESYPDQWLTFKSAGQLYLDPSQHWRRHCHKLWNRLQVRAEILEAVRRFTTQHFLKLNVAVLIRANSHAGEQMFNRTQTLDEYAAAIQKEICAEKSAQVYVASNDQESLDWMRQRFPVICHPQTKRSATRDIDRHLAEPQTVQDAILALVEVLIMSACNTLIHPISNMSTAALFINPQLKSVFLP